MDLHLWLGFAAASALMGLIPGPGVMGIVGYALGSGKRVALASVAGMAVGNVAAMTLSLGGVGVMLAASAGAFAILKWAGALYLVGLGLLTLWRSFRAGSVPDGVDRRPISPRLAFTSNLALGTFHPKTIAFFFAFVPQFIDPAGSYLGQSVILVTTFAAVLATTDTVYALAASRAASSFGGPKALAWSRRASGGVLLACGVATAAMKRA